MGLGKEYYGGYSKVAVAIDKDKNSQNALKWAVENLLVKGQTVDLLHVITKGAKDEASTISQAKELLHPFRCYCTRKNVQCNDIILEDGDIAKAIIDFTCQKSIEKLVVGAPSKTGLLRLRMTADISTTVSKGTPDFCNVYVVNKGKLTSLRNAVRAAPPTPRGRISQSLFQSQISMKLVDQSPTRGGGGGGAGTHAFRSGGDWTPTKSPFSSSSSSSSSRARGGQTSTTKYVQGDLTSTVPDTTNDSFFTSGRPSIDRLFPRGSSKPVQDLLSQLSEPADISFVSSGRASIDYGAGIPPRRSNAEELDDHTFDYKYSSNGYSGQDRGGGGGSSFRYDQVLQVQEEDHQDWGSEMARLRQELKQTMDMYSNACKEALTAKQKATELQQWKIQEEEKLEEARVAEEAARAMVEKEKAKAKAAVEAAEASKRIAELEARKRRNAERKAAREAEEKKKALDALSAGGGGVVAGYGCRKYSLEEIEAATSNFAEELKIGEGGYGPVYKCRLDHTPVAIKILRAGSDAAQGRAQFQQEVEILSCIRHPNMVLLLGACPEMGCLVYEYMAKGSLEDLLFFRGTTPTTHARPPPLPWQHRFRIAAEIGTALLFLHQTKPDALVHRDLKPANILIDDNYVSKISDVGLARLVPPSLANAVTQYRMTSTAGTFCYIDPEYQQTGMLGIKSDIYSLGILLLQLITAKPPMGLTHHVERALEKGTFLQDMLDPAVTDWPFEDALTLAKLALKCSELRRKDRPDLSTVILPELNRLRDIATASMQSCCTTAAGSSIHTSASPPVLLLLHSPQVLSMQGLLSGPLQEQSGYAESRASISSSSSSMTARGLVIGEL